MGNNHIRRTRSSGLAYRELRTGTRRGGFSLLELMIALTVLVVSLGAAVSAVVETASLRMTTRETRLALDAAMSVLEGLRAADFADVFTLYNADPTDDPLGGAPGSGFAVRGLSPEDGDVDGLPGEVVFPGGGFQLIENVVIPALGMPRDLNLDGAVDGANHAPDAVLIPVMVRVRWQGTTGAREVRLVTTIYPL